LIHIDLISHLIAWLKGKSTGEHRKTGFYHPNMGVPHLGIELCRRLSPFGFLLQRRVLQRGGRRVGRRAGTFRLRPREHWASRVSWVMVGWLVG